MLRIARMLPLAIAALSLALVGAGRAAAGSVVYSYYYGAPAVSCYSPPAVSYYSAPAVSYYSAPAVSYYSAPAVSYYSAPTVTYYTPSVSYYSAPSAVTTTRYGLFGRPRYSTTYYP